MPPSRLDAIYRSILINKFFTKGWGSPENLKKLFEFRKIIANRKLCYNLIPRDYPITITKDERWSDCRVIEGKFESPFERNLPGIMPEATKTAYFQMILPKQWNSQKIKPICLHLAGTGDHYFWRRRNFIARPLLKESGIASVLLENPFYGCRKPKDQIQSNLHNVSDIFIMGASIILESTVILNWCEQQGYAPLGLTGLSMGGHMASLAATNWPKPIPLVPCLSWSTASPVFTKGVMSDSINWSLLESQYFENKTYQNDLAKMVKVIHGDDAYLAGQYFAKHFPKSMNTLNKIKNESTEPVKEKENTDNKESTINLSPDTNEDKNKVDKKTHIEEHAVTQLFPMKFISNKLKNKSNLKKNQKWREPEALQFMKGIMDECTHLQNFEVPVDTELIIAVCARDDAYVPRDDCVGLEKIWPKADIRFVDAGHVSAYVLYQKMFRSTIAEAFQKYLRKYPINDS